MRAPNGGPAVLLVGLLFAGRLFDSPARVPRMAAVTVTDVTHNADGTKTVVLDGDVSLDLSVADLTALADPAEPGVVLHKLWAMYWKARSPTFGSSTSVVGKVFQLDMGLEIGHLLVGAV
jgi:hypothetical protein